MSDSPNHEGSSSPEAPYPADPTPGLSHASTDIQRPQPLSPFLWRLGREQKSTAGFPREQFGRWLLKAHLSLGLKCLSHHVILCS